MQSIERYGLVALLFLVVTVVAVLVWDEDATVAASPVARAERARAGDVEAAAVGRAAPAESSERPGRRRAKGQPQRVELNVAPEPRALDRAALAAAEREERRRRAAPPGERRAGAETRAASQAPSAGRTSAALANTTGALASPAVNPGDGTRGPRDGTSGGWTRAQPERDAGRVARPEREADTSGAGGVRYEIRPGDTLGEISLRHLGTVKRWREIVTLNPGLDPDRIVAGRVLTLPGDARVAAQADRSSRAVPPTPSREATSTRAGTYAVRSGDSLWKIAARELGNGERWRDIAKLNPKVDPNRLHVGQRIALPETSSPTRGGELGVPKPGQLVAANIGGGLESAGGRVR